MEEVGVVNGRTLALQLTSRGTGVRCGRWDKEVLILFFADNISSFMG